jgi:hypothetical protein
VRLGLLVFVWALFLANDVGPRAAVPAAPVQQVPVFQTLIETLEYQPTQTRGALSAPNRAQGLRLTFGEDGLSIEPREGGAEPVVLGLRAFGRPGLERALGKAEARLSVENRVERHWEGMTEWFVNQPEGVEHGWTVQEKARGRGPLVLSVAVIGARVDVSNSAAVFASDSVRVLHYGKLKAFDVEGTALSAQLFASEEGLRIEVDDAAARYPVVIDPLLTSSAWTAESNQADARFGIATASAGDVNGDGYSDVVVGAYTFDNGESNEGRAFLYLGSTNGLSLAPAWTAEGNQIDAWFGWSVASAGDVNGDGYSDVIVGAQQLDGNTGRALLYLGSPMGLSLTPAWTAESNQAGAAFGISVASAGDVNGDGYSDVVVGASQFDNGEMNEGRAYLYLGSASGLSPAPSWTAESNQVEAAFGFSVASAGDVNGDGFSDVLVGASFFDNMQTNDGRVFLYLGSPTGLALTAAWTAETNQAEALFGVRVASAGDVNGDGYSDVVVGAKGFDNGQADEGRAFLYFGSASGLSLNPGWTAESNQVGAEFGVSVASAGDVNGDGYSDVVVGARMFDNGHVGEGRAFLYLGSASGLSQIPAWTGETDQPSAQIAWVSGAGDVNGDGYSDVMMSSVFFDGGEADEGRAFLYLGRASGLTKAPTGTVMGNQAYAQFASVVSSAGDVNGDGYSDVVGGAPFFDNGQSDEGRAFLYLGSSSSFSPTPVWTAESNQAGASFGWSVASAGDVNGDGYSDVVVGAPNFANGEPNEGRAFLFLGSASGLSSTPVWTAESNRAGAWFGWNVAGAGDVNGDGYSDVVVGAPNFANGEPNEGRAFLFLGSASGLSATSAWTAESNQAYAQFATLVSGAGDVNGDGYSDVVVGASLFDNGEPDEGRAFLFLGGASGLSSTPAWTAESNQAGARFGTSAASAGDVNADGYSDLVVGVADFPSGGAQGRAVLYLGSSRGLSPTPAWTADGNQAGALFGSSLASAGDVNGDGYSDVVIGAKGFDNGQADEGRAFVYLGSESGLSPAPGWTAESNQVSASFGGSVASVGDINGDGFSDVVVGAPRFDNGLPDEGDAFVFLGGDEAPGLSRGLEQKLAGRTPTGASSQGAAPVTLSALGFNALTTQGRVVLETEVKPLGTRFNGNELVKSSPGLARLRQFVTWTMIVPGRYHWRARLVSGQERGRWISFGGNAETEADFVVLDSPVDAGSLDAGPDAGGVDGGSRDAGSDAGRVDAGSRDAGADAGRVDAGIIDGGRVDSGVLDGGGTEPTMDSGLLDAGGGSATDGTIAFFVSTAGGCQAAPGTLSLLLVLAMFRRRARS